MYMGVYVSNTQYDRSVSYLDSHTTVYISHYLLLDVYTQYPPVHTVYTGTGRYHTPGTHGGIQVQVHVQVQVQVHPSYTTARISHWTVHVITRYTSRYYVLVCYMLRLVTSCYVIWYVLLRYMLRPVSYMLRPVTLDGTSCYVECYVLLRYMLRLVTLHVTSCYVRWYVLLR